MINPAMAGGPAPAPAGGGGVPPQIAALLAGGGGAPAPAPAPAQGGSGQDARALNDMIEAALRFIQSSPDAVEREAVAKCLAILKGIQANEQKMHDQALGGTADPRLLRKAGAY